MFFFLYWTHDIDERPLKFYACKLEDGSIQKGWEVEGSENVIFKAILGEANHGRASMHECPTFMLTQIRTAQERSDGEHSSTVF